MLSFATLILLKATAHHRNGSRQVPVPNDKDNSALMPAIDRRSQRVVLEDDRASRDIHPIILSYEIRSYVEYLSEVIGKVASAKSLKFKRYGLVPTYPVASLSGMSVLR